MALTAQGEDLHEFRDTHMENKNFIAGHEDEEVRHYADGVIDRFGYLTDDMIYSIVKDVPNFNKSNARYHRDKLIRYAKTHEREQLGYFERVRSHYVQLTG